MKNKSLTPIIVFGIVLVFVIAISYNISRINKENTIDNENSNQSTNNDTTGADTTSINRNSNISDIVIDEDKINIYFFYGETCPHCEELFAYFESINDEYSKYYNIYAFEVWNNDENAEFMNKFGSVLRDNTESRSVPYYIIGDKSFSGYIESMNEEIENTIISKYNDRANINRFNDIIKQ